MPSRMPHRAAELAAAGIPPEGAIHLVRRDAQIQGRKLFKVKCAQCHDAAGGKADDGQPKYNAAPKLERFASRDWLAGLLSAEAVDGPDYFGRTSHHAGDMVKFVQEDLKDWKRDEIEDVIIALSAEAHLPEQAELDARDRERIAAGTKLIKDDSRCAQCHVFYDAGAAGSAPDLTGYGSRKWLVAFISNPAAERFYGQNNDRMPAFADHPPGSPQNELGPQAIELLADWLRHDWNQGRGAEPVEAPVEPAAESGAGKVVRVFAPSFSSVRRAHRQRPLGAQRKSRTASSCPGAGIRRPCPASPATGEQSRQCPRKRQSWRNRYSSSALLPIRMRDHKAVRIAPRFPPNPGSRACGVNTADKTSRAWPAPVRGNWPAPVAARLSWARAVRRTSSASRIWPHTESIWPAANGSPASRP